MTPVMCQGQLGSGRLQSGSDAKLMRCSGQIEPKTKLKRHTQNKADDQRDNHK